jgi:hypothetical protein
MEIWILNHIKINCKKVVVDSLKEEQRVFLRHKKEEERKYLATKMGLLRKS